MKSAAPSVEEISPHLAGWMASAQMRLMKKKKVGPKQLKAAQARAATMLNRAKETGFIEVLNRRGVPIAVFLLMKPKAPRVKGERVLFFEYHPKRRQEALRWVKRCILVHGKAAPRNSRIGASEQDANYLARALAAAGFPVRYDIQWGDTAVALRNLLRKKNPPDSLAHLGLHVRTLKSARDVRQAIALQRRVFSRVPEHGNFSHTSAQLRRDQQEFANTIREGRGCILGIYREGKLLGFMAAFIHDIPDLKARMGGISFCLDPRIQGLGITKTGYRLLLSYFQQQKVKRFYGGTSQPAIRKLGSVMGRKVEHVLFVKASWKR